MQKIDYETALRALNEAVRKNGPDYVDQHAKAGLTCRNVVVGEDGYEPSCIVGTALVWLGVPVRWFKDADCVQVGASTATYELQKAGLMSFTEEAVSLMLQAQGQQDGGTNWGDAVAWAHLGDREFHSLKPREVFDPAESGDVEG